MLGARTILPRWYVLGGTISLAGSLNTYQQDFSVWTTITAIVRIGELVAVLFKDDDDDDTLPPSGSTAEVLLLLHYIVIIIVVNNTAEEEEQ